jgi:hypothetical protein
MDAGFVYALKTDDASIALMLRACAARWPGQRIRLYGSREFKARAMALSAERGMGLELVSEPEPKPRRGMDMGR